MLEPVLITDSDRTTFAAAIRAHGWCEADFELELESLDPNTAEVEACLGKAGVRCLPAEAVEVYRLVVRRGQIVPSPNPTRASI